MSGWLETLALRGAGLAPAAGTIPLAPRPRARFEPGGWGGLVEAPMGPEAVAEEAVAPRAEAAERHRRPGLAPAGAPRAAADRTSSRPVATPPPGIDGHPGTRVEVQPPNPTEPRQAGSRAPIPQAAVTQTAGRPIRELHRQPLTAAPAGSVDAGRPLPPSKTQEVAGGERGETDAAPAETGRAAAPAPAVERSERTVERWVEVAAMEPEATSPPARPHSSPPSPPSLPSLPSSMPSRPSPPEPGRSGVEPAPVTVTIGRIEVEIAPPPPAPAARPGPERTRGFDTYTRARRGYPR